MRILGLPCGGANDAPTVLGGRSHNRGTVVFGGRELGRPRERNMLARVAAVAISVLLAVALMAAQARAATITEYPLPTANNNPQEIVAGADGALWFTETLGHQIGRINSSGAVTEYPLPTANTSSLAIAAGSDGALWFTEAANRIGRITTSGAVTDYPLPTGQYTSAGGIAAGSDGALWFTEESSASGYPSQIGRITTSGAFSQYPVLGSPNNIAAGPDGALWFTEPNRSQIGRITTSGAVTYYPTPTASSYPNGIAAGPDGALWFTEYGVNQIGRISTSGVVTEFPIPTANSHPIRIAAGPDGALWFTEQQTNQIGRITTSGAVTEYPIPTANSHPAGIAKGPDGALWFIEQFANKVGRITTGAISLSVSDMAVSEPASGSSAAALQVSLSAASDKPVTVDYATHDGTQPDGATSAENDYTPMSGSLTFAPGETVKTVSVPVNHVGNAEAKETFTVELSGESGADVAKRVGTVTIRPPTTVSGTVLSQGGQPVPGVQIDVSDASGVQATGMTDTNGSYQTGPLPAGSYTVTPHSNPEQYSPPAQQVTIDQASVNANFTHNLHLDQLSPTTGSPAGGQTITLTGYGFGPAGGTAEVRFGSTGFATAATDVQVLSDTQIIATTPEDLSTSSDGVTPIAVKVNQVSSNLVPFTYRLKITELSRSSGSPAGGQQITITGEGFGLPGPSGSTSKPSGVTFEFFTAGSEIKGPNLRTQATRVTVVSDSVITAIIPPLPGLLGRGHDPGFTERAMVSVQIGKHSSANELPFDYKVHIGSVSPTRVSRAGGPIIILGHGFGLPGNNQVLVQLKEQIYTEPDLTNVRVVSDTEITATAPPLHAGSEKLFLTLSVSVAGLFADNDLVPFTYDPPSVPARGKPKIAARTASVSHDAVAVKISCTGAGPCSGAAKITAIGAQAARITRGRSRATIVASGRYSIPAGKTETVMFTLTRAGRRLLRKHHGTLRTTLKITPNSGKPLPQSLILMQRTKALKHR